MPWQDGVVFGNAARGLYITGWVIWGLAILALCGHCLDDEPDDMRDCMGCPIPMDLCVSRPKTRRPPPKAQKATGMEAVLAKRLEKLRCANGMLQIGSRVKTQWSSAEGGDDGWYQGVVTRVNGTTATIRYDDGDTWTGDATHMHLVTQSQTV